MYYISEMCTIYEITTYIYIYISYYIWNVLETCSGEFLVMPYKYPKYLVASPGGLDA